MSDWEWRPSPFGPQYEGSWQPGPEAQAMLGRARVKDHDVRQHMYRTPTLYLFPTGTMPAPEGQIFGVPFIETDKVSEPSVVV